MKTLLLALLLTQQATPYIETLEVRVNNIDVVVTDRDGKPVTGLRKEDFIVLEDGKPQTVTNFAAYGESAGTAAAPAAAPQQPEPAAVAASHVPRHYVFFIDEMALHPVSRGKLLKSAKELMQKTMQAGDEAMIITPAAKKKIPLAFTGDQAQIFAELGRVMAAYNSSALTQEAVELRSLTTALAMAEGQIAASAREKLIKGAIMEHAEAVRRRVEQRLGHLRSIVSGMSEISGRKALVLVTTDLPVTPGKDVVDQYWQLGWGQPQVGRDYFEMTPQLDEIAQLAAVNGITIYSLQPDFKQAEVIGGPDISLRGGAVRAARDWHSELVQNEQALNAISAPTGGTFLRGDGGVPELFRQISTDVTTYYSLGYRATEEDTDKAHRVEVRVKDHPELRVRARRDVMRKSPGKEIEDLTVAALLRGGVNELGIGAESGALIREGRQIIVPVIVHVPLKTLTFLPAANDVQHANFRVHFALLGERADFGTGEAREQAIDIPSAELDAARAKHFTYETRLRVAPGKYRVAVGVFDPVSRLAGFQTLEIEAK